MAEWLTDSGFNPGNEIQIKACKSIVSPRWRVFAPASCVVHFKSHLPDILLANGALYDLNCPLSTWNLSNRDRIASTFINIANVCASKKSVSPFKGSIPQPELDGPSRKKIGSKSVSGLRRLSTISEQEPDKLDNGSHDSWGGSDWAGSSFSMCSDKFKNSCSHFSSDDSYQPDTGGINYSSSATTI